MKKLLTALLAMLLLLTAIPVLADEVEIRNPLPDEIADLFDVPAWEDYHVPATTEQPNELAWIWFDEHEAGLVVQKRDDVNVLCLVQRIDGKLRITGRNFEAIPEGDDIPWLSIVTGDDAAYELFGDGYYLAFAFDDSGKFRTRAVLDSNAWMLVLVNSNKLGYVKGVLTEDGGIDYDADNPTNVYGTYDNRFEAFNWMDFPMTLTEAREKLTTAPETPSDFYSPVRFTLRANEKYDVFAAPGRDSYRAANGKAEMSTNDWVQIFGEEDGWLLVQYDISSDQMRFGYVDASALPRGKEVQALTWYDLPEQTVRYGVSVTDDPLVSASVILRLDAGDTVKVLSEFGTWCYIETQDAYGRDLRGFIPQTAIDLVTWNDLEK